MIVGFIFEYLGDSLLIISPLKFMLLLGSFLMPQLLFKNVFLANQSIASCYLSADSLAALSTRLTANMRYVVLLF